MVGERRVDRDVAERGHTQWFSPSMGNTVVHFRSNFYPGDRKIKCSTGIDKE